MATLALSGPSLVKAGAGVSAVMTAGAGGEVDVFIEQAEAYLSALTKSDLVANWITISGPAAILTEYCERSAAVEAVAYDMSGYGVVEGAARIVAEDIININLFRMNEIIDLLKVQDNQAYLGI